MTGLRAAVRVALLATLFFFLGASRGAYADEGETPKPVYKLRLELDVPIALIGVAGVSSFLFLDENGKGAGVPAEL